MASIQINLDGWQDYRGMHTGILFFNTTSKQAVLPVRDQMNEREQGFLEDPNYETRTIGLKSSYRAKDLNAIAKAKHRYILLTNKYEGISPEFKNKYLIYGYFRIDKTRDVRSLHIHHYMSGDNEPEPECLNLDKSMALYSEDFNLYSLEDSLELTKEFLVECGQSGRISRQMKLVFADNQLDKILEHFSSKTPINQEYIDTVSEFKDFLEEEEEIDQD